MSAFCDTYWDTWDLGAQHMTGTGDRGQRPDSRLLNPCDPEPSFSQLQPDTCLVFHCFFHGDKCSQEEARFAGLVCCTDTAGVM